METSKFHFIIIYGVDGSGKSTAVSELCTNLSKLGISAINYDEYKHNTKNPTDMSVNRIESGIENMDELIIASGEEIYRRLERYKNEVKSKDEKLATVLRTKQILNQYNIYLSNLSLNRS